LGRKQKVKNGEGNGLRNYDIIAEQFDISGRHVLRYYKLNFLIDEFKKLVETNFISISAAIKVADLNPLTQKWIYDTFRTKINSKNLIKINNKMDRSEIERVFNQEGLSEEKIEVKYVIPFRLKAEFDLYVEEFFKKNLVT
jgi:ParB family chromosome partitioning protein